MADDKKTVVKMAYIYSQEGRWDKAAAEYKKLIAMDPEDFNAQNMLGDVFVKKGEYQAAFDAYIVVADAYSRLGQAEKTTVVCRKIARLDASQLSGDAKKKQTMLQKQVEGETALESGELDKAAEAFKMVLQLDSERFDIYQKLGDIYLQQGQIEQAVKQYNEIADIYFKNKLYKKATPLYKKIIELDPGHVEAHAGIGEIHVRSGNESDAKKEYLLIAEAMLAKGDLETSIAYSKKALQLKSIEAYYFLGRAYLLQKKHEEARVEFEKLLKFKLNHVGALVSMGEILEAKGQPVEAQQQYERALKVEKTHVAALAALASLHAKKGDKARAEALYTEAADACAILNLSDKVDKYRALAAKLHPDNQDAHASITLALPLPEPSPLPPPVPAPAPAAAKPAEEPKPVIAPASLAAALPEIDPAEERAILMSMAENYVMEKSYDEAIELYHRILTASPDDKEAKGALAGVYSMVAKGAFPVNLPQASLAPPAAPPAAPVAAVAPVEVLAALPPVIDLKAAAEVASELAKQAEAEMRKHLEIEIRKQIEEEMRHKMLKQAAEAAAAVVASTLPPLPQLSVPAAAPSVPKKKSKVSYL